MYKANGYIYWFADPAYKEVGNHRVDIDVKIFEGDKFYLGRFEVKGNTTTRDKVIRREFALDEGAVMDMDAVKKSLQKLQQLGYFKVSEEPEFGVDQEQRKVNLTVKGTETSRNEVQFGAGYSAVDKFFGQFSFQTRNFMGRGEVLGGLRPDRQDLELLRRLVHGSLVHGPEPVGRRLDLPADRELPEHRREPHGHQRLLRPRARPLLVVEPALPVRVGQGEVSGARGADASRAADSARQADRHERKDLVFHAGLPLRHAATIRSIRRSGGVSSRASRSPAALSEAPTISSSRSLGGTIYIPVRFPRHSYIAANLEVGWVANYGGHDVPIFERFQLGGEQSLRGFQTGSILPLQKNNQVFTDSLGRILGGNKFYVLNLEYTFLQFGPGKMLAFRRPREHVLSTPSPSIRPTSGTRWARSCASFCRSSRRLSGSSTSSTRTSSSPSTSSGSPSPA